MSNIVDTKQEFNMVPHLQNSLIYAIDEFLKLHKDKFEKSKNDESEDNMREVDENIIMLQYGIPFINISIRTDTHVLEDGQFIISRSNNILILEDKIKESNEKTLRLAHTKLNQFFNEFYNNEIDPYNDIDHLKFSYIYKLNHYNIEELLKESNIYIGTDNNKSFFDIDKIPIIPGVVFKTVIKCSITTSSSNKLKDKSKVELKDISINYKEILDTISMKNIIEAHEILDDFINNNIKKEESI